MRLFLTCILLFSSLNTAQANWRNDTIENPFAHMRIQTLSIADGFNDTLSIACASYESDQRAVPSISIYYGLGFSSSGTVKMDFKVDSKPTITLNLLARLDAGSNKKHQTAHYVADTSTGNAVLSTLIDQFIAGYQVQTVVTKLDGSKRTNVFSLIGFTKGYRQYNSQCDFQCCSVKDS